jgi:hypothetical protein
MHFTIKAEIGGPSVVRIDVAERPRTPNTVTVVRCASVMAVAAVRTIPAFFRHQVPQTISTTPGWTSRTASMKK